MTEPQIVSRLRKLTSEIGQKNWARENGISQCYISLVLSGHHGPGKKILAALGYERVVTYRRIGGGK